MTRKVSVTPGMARAMKKLGVRTSCTECGFDVPRYVGRYPNVCPGCGHVFASAHDKVDSKVMQRALKLLEGLEDNEALLRKVYTAYEVKGEPGMMSETKQVRSPDRKLQAEGLFFDDTGYHIELSVRDGKGSRLEKAFGARPDLKAWLELVPFVDAERSLQILEGVSSKREIVEAVRAWINRGAHSYWGAAHLVYEQRDCCTGTLTVYAPDMYNIPLETLDLSPTGFKHEARKRYRATTNGWEHWESFGGQGGEHEKITLDPDDFEVDVHLTLKPAGVGGENQFPMEDMVEVRVPGFNIITIHAGIVNAWLEGMSQGNMTDPGIADRTVRVVVTEVYELMARSGQFLDDYSTGEGTGRLTSAELLLQYLRIVGGTVPRLEQQMRIATGEPLIGRQAVFRAPSGAIVEGEIIGQDGGILVIRTVDGSINTVDIENVISTEVVAHEQDDVTVDDEDDDEELDTGLEAYKREVTLVGNIGVGGDRPLGKPQRAPTVAKKDTSLGTKGVTCPPGFVFDFRKNECVKGEDTTTFLIKQGLLQINEGARVWMDGEEYRVLLVHNEGHGVDLVKMDRTATILKGISPLNLDRIEQAQPKREQASEVDIGAKVELTDDAGDEFSAQVFPAGTTGILIAVGDETVDIDLGFGEQIRVARDVVEVV